MSILASRNITKAFGEFIAVKEVSLEFAERQFTSIIGPNGAGKSTYFNLLSGRYKPTSGSLFFKEKDVTGYAPHEMMRLGMGRSFQITNIFPGLSAHENMRIGVLAHTGQSMHLFRSVDSLDDANKVAQKHLEQVGLGEKGDTLAGALSYGDQRRLEIGLALTCNPIILLLDEPTAGMTPEETKVFTGLIKEISESQGLTVILTEHDMEMVFSVSERIIVLQAGSVIADGNPDEIRANPQVRKAYLGDEGQC